MFNRKSILIKKLLSSRRFRWLIASLAHKKYLVSVSMVAFNNSKQILLATHSWNEDYKWRLPGGLVSKDLTLEIALAREIREELGININKKYLRFVKVNKVSIFPRIDVYFVYKKPLRDTIKLGLELKEVKFFNTNRIPSNIFPGQNEIIKDASAMISYRKQKNL